MNSHDSKPEVTEQPLETPTRKKIVDSAKDATRLLTVTAMPMAMSAMLMLNNSGASERCWRC